MARPRQWQPFSSTELYGYEYTDDGRIRDKSRNVLNDDHRLFRYRTRAEILAEEFFGLPPRHDCQYCGIRGMRDGKYHGPIRGGGPRFRIVHLDDDPKNCARDNLKYVPDYAAMRMHELNHAEECGRSSGHHSSRYHDGPPRIRFAGPAAGATSHRAGKGSAFKIRGEHSVPDQTRAMRFLSLPMDYRYLTAPRRVQISYVDES